MKKKFIGLAETGQKRKGRFIRLTGWVLPVLVVFSGCRAAPVLDRPEPSSQGQTVSAPAPDPVFEPEALEVTAAGQTISLLPDGEPSCTVALPEELPALEDETVPVQIFFGEKQVFSGSAGELADFLPEKNGLYRYVFDGGTAPARWLSRRILPRGLSGGRARSPWARSCPYRCATPTPSR